MPRRFIDISVPLESGIKSDPDFMLPKITYHPHKETAAQLCALFPGLEPDQLPEGMGWAMEDIELTTHNGTHVDAPWRVVAHHKEPRCTLVRRPAHQGAP